MTSRQFLYIVVACVLAVLIVSEVVSWFAWQYASVASSIDIDF